MYPHGMSGENAGSAESLPTAACMTLLRSVPAGRLVYTENALPAVLQVTFAILAGEVVIPTGGDPWFRRFDGGVLAFETGAVDPSTRSGWTVLVIGHARLVSGLEGLHDVNDVSAIPWDPSVGGDCLVIDGERITGHRIRLLRPTGDRR